MSHCGFQNEIFNFFLIFSLKFCFNWGVMQKQKADAKGREMNGNKLPDIKDNK